MHKAAIVIDHDKNNNCHPKRAHVKRNLSSFVFFFVLVSSWFLSRFPDHPRSLISFCFIFLIRLNETYACLFLLCKGRGLINLNVMIISWECCLELARRICHNCSGFPSHFPCNSQIFFS